MRDQPEPTEREQDQPPQRRKKEDATRYPGHEDPERTIKPAPGSETQTARGGGELRPEPADGDE